jgi:hypothetical protein
MSGPYEGADPAGLAALRDRAAVTEVVARLAHAQDDRDWPALRALFAEEVLLDLSTHQHGTPPTTLPAAELLALARRTLDGFDHTHHLATDLLPTVSGDEAECRAHVLARHELDTGTGAPGHVTMRGLWRLGLRRSGGRWLIDRWAVVRTAPWEGDPGLYARAAARLAPPP